MNSTQHGCRSLQTVLFCEDQSQFDQLLDALNAEFTPQSLSEELLVHQFAETEWRRRRAVRAEACIINNVHEYLVLFDDNLPGNPPNKQLARTVDQSYDKIRPSLNCVQREVDRTSRLFLRLEKRLSDMQASRPSPPPAQPAEQTRTNEPKKPHPSPLIVLPNPGKEDPDDVFRPPTT